MLPHPGGAGGGGGGAGSGDSPRREGAARRRGREGSGFRATVKTERVVQSATFRWDQGNTEHVTVVASAVAAIPSLPSKISKFTL